MSAPYGLFLTGRYLRFCAEGGGKYPHELAAEVKKDVGAGLVTAEDAALILRWCFLAAMDDGKGGSIMAVILTGITDQSQSLTQQQPE